VAAALPLALASLTACGPNDDTAPASSASDSSSASSSTSPADTPSAGETVAPADFVKRFESGFAKTTTAHETMSLSGGSGSFNGEGDVDYTQDSPAMAMTMTSDMMGGKMEIRLVDGVIYMRIPPMTGQKFIKMDLNDPNSPFGSLGSQLDPQEALKTFSQGIDSVTYVGDEGGLGHYRVTVDTKKALAEMKGGAAAAQAGLPAKLDYDLWLDDQDRITRMTMDLGQAGTMEMKLSDFGKDVQVEAPPASQITDAGGMQMG
jgi:hypothetical protein